MLSDPRKRISVKPPKGPVCETFKLGRVRNKAAGSNKVRAENVSVSITEILLPTNCCGVGR